MTMKHTKRFFGKKSSHITITSNSFLCGTATVVFGIIGVTSQNDNFAARIGIAIWTGIAVSLNKYKLLHDKCLTGWMILIDRY